MHEYARFAHGLAFWHDHCPFNSINVTTESETSTMLKWAVIFAVLALISGLLGFTGLAGAFATIAKVLFIIFLILLIVFALLGFFTVKKAKDIL